MEGLIYMCVLFLLMKGAPKQPDLGVETLDLHSEGEEIKGLQLHMLQRGEAKQSGWQVLSAFGGALRLMLGSG